MRDTDDYHSRNGIPTFDLFSRGEETPAQRAGRMLSNVSVTVLAIVGALFIGVQVLRAMGVMQ
jgi:hypothetical protein